MVVETAEGRHRSALHEAGPITTGVKAARLVVAGEALIDLVTTDGQQYAAHVGGSPLNVAVGAARLGLDTAFLARISTDPFGDRIVKRLTDNGVRDRLVCRVDAPSSLAVATLDEQGNAAYQFYLDGTADGHWEAMPQVNDADVLHLGSLAMRREPALFESMARGSDALISYDPNVRPGDHSRDEEVTRVERQVALAHVVKASEEDLRSLYPGADIGQVARHWVERGPALVVITRGAAGAVALTASVYVARPTRIVTVVDTVGAGDSATAGLLAALAERDLLSSNALTQLTPNDLTDIVDFALRCAAITVSRAGAAPPTRGEVIGAH